nr:Unknown [Haemonchus contortus]
MTTVSIERSFFILTTFIILRTQCHCPHMMGMPKKEKVEGPAAPSSLPEGDKGWDYDENAAPGITPQDYFIQTTFIHRSENRQQKDYAELVMTKLGELRDRLRKMARVTVDNEVISCVEDSEHYRCGDFKRDSSYHYLVIEDSSSGAAVYSLERKLNGKNLGAIEMALLDALSRHSPSPLTIYATPEAEREIGFVRALTPAELKAASKPAPLDVEVFSPTEIDLIDTDLLELRSGEELAVADHKLVSFASSDEFTKLRNSNKHVIVLFWSHVHSVSLHAFNLWARTSKIAKFHEDVVLAHVECHNHPEFCEGLDRKDFHTIVAYRNGENIGSTYYLRDEAYYLQWIYLMVSGPLIELGNDDSVKKAKKGLIFGSSPHPTTIGTFPDRDCAEYLHFKIAAERLHGRYFIAVIMKPGSTATVTVYRPTEKQRRQDYTGKFDSATLMAFISTASFPSVVDISKGFTTNLLFRQPRKIAILVATPTFGNSSYASLATRKDARRAVVFTYLNRDMELSDEIMTQFKIESSKTPQILLLDKTNVHQLLLNSSTTSDRIWEWIQIRNDEEATKELSMKDPHPLRLLQKAQVDTVFGVQNTMILPDESFYRLPEANVPPHHPTIGGDSGGGCPFMMGHGLGGAVHEEL